MGQTKLGSLIESVMNTAIGFIIAIVAQTWYLWFADIQISHTQNIGLVIFMTVISVIRSYVLRRVFNRRTK